MAMHLCPSPGCASRHQPREVSEPIEWLTEGAPTNNNPWAWELPAWRPPKALWGRTFPLNLDGASQIIELLHGKRSTRRLRAQRAHGRRGQEGGHA